MADDLHAALMQRVKVVEKGRTRTITVQALIFRNLALNAGRKDLGAARPLFQLVSRYALSDQAQLDIASLEAADRGILEEYIARTRDAREASASEE